MCVCASVCYVCGRESSEPSPLMALGQSCCFWCFLQGRALPTHFDCSSVLLPVRTQSFGRCPCISVVKVWKPDFDPVGLAIPYAFCFCVCVRCGPPPVPCVMVEKLENRSRVICSWCCCDREPLDRHIVMHSCLLPHGRCKSIFLTMLLSPIAAYD